MPAPAVVADKGIVPVVGRGDGQPVAVGGVGVRIVGRAVLIKGGIEQVDVPRLPEILPLAPVVGVGDVLQLGWGCLLYTSTATYKGNVAGSTGLPLASFSNAAHFSGWDFAHVWRMDAGAGRPVLRVFDNPKDS